MDNNMDKTKIFINTVFPVYISMTTIPSRLKNTIKIVKNMIKYIKGIKGIILNVCESYKEVKNKNFINKHLIELQGLQGCIINLTEDIGPITKLVPSLDITPEECIIVICDDEMYHHDAFKMIAEKQDRQHHKTFTFWKYDYQGIDVPQGVDLISFWKPNLNELKNFWKMSSSNKHCFFVDDLVIGLYLHNRGIEIEKIPRPWKFPFIPSSKNETESLFKKKGEYSRDNSMKKCLLFMG